MRLSFFRLTLGEFVSAFATTMYSPFLDTENHLGIRLFCGVVGISNDLLFAFVKMYSQVSLGFIYEIPPLFQNNLIISEMNRRCKSAFIYPGSKKQTAWLHCLSSKIHFLRQYRERPHREAGSLVRFRDDVEN